MTSNVEIAKKIALTVGLTFGVGAELLIFWPRFLILWTLLFCFFYSILLYGAFVKTRSEYGFSILILLSLLFIFTIVFLFFIDNNNLKQVYVLLLSVVLYKIHLWVYLMKSDGLGLLQLFKFLSIGMVFLIYTVLFKLVVLFDLGLVWLALLGGLAVFFISLAVFNTIDSLSAHRKLSYALVLGMILLQSSWIIGFFPTGYYVNGGLIVFIYYLYIDLFILYFNMRSLKKRSIVISSCFSVVCVFIILISANWI